MKIIKFLNNQIGIHLVRYYHRRIGGGASNVNPYTGVPGAYVLKHIASGKVYVGGTGNLAGRCSKNKSALKRGCQSNAEFQALFDSDPRIVVYVQCAKSKRKAHALEQNLVDLCVKTGLLCNVATEDVVRTHLGIKLSKRHKAILRRANVNKVVSEETREKLRESHLGKELPSELRRKLSKVHKKRLATKGGKAAHARGIAKLSHQVSCDGVVYPSKSAAARSLGMDVTSVMHRCKSPNYPTFFVIDME